MRRMTGKILLVMSLAGLLAGTAAVNAFAASSFLKKAAAKKLQQTETAVYGAEIEYHAEDYPSLAEKGTASGAEIDNFNEAMGDMELFSFSEAGIREDSGCGKGWSQFVIYDDENKARVVETKLQTGNPLMDPVMKRVGYEYYSVSYEYTHTAWRPAGEDMNRPICAHLEIDGNDYTYYFAGDQLIQRDGPDGTGTNVKTNDFIQNVYKIGCYYGNALRSEEGRKAKQNLTMYSGNVEKKDGYYVWHAKIVGRNGEYALILDKNTVFSDDAEKEFFSYYESGDTALAWCDKAYADPKEYITPLVGIFEVRLTGDHIDELCGSYWWD